MHVVNICVIDTHMKSPLCSEGTALETDQQTKGLHQLQASELTT